MIKSYKESKSYIYAIEVTTGDRIACKWIKLQAERFLNDLKRGDLYFDLDWHHKVSVFFEEILYVEELREPSELLPPHAFWIEQLHCLRYKATGFKKYKSVYAQMARKQAKTFMAGGNALFELVWGADPSPDIMCGANSRDQAIICTNMMGKLIRNSPDLRSEWDISKKHEMSKPNSGDLKLHVHAGDVHKILYSTDGKDGRIVAMPRDPGDGGNPSMTIIDELHEAKDLTLLETMRTGQGLRKEPLVVIITSPGVNKDAPCYSVLRKKSVDLLNGIIEDDNHLPIIFELDSEDEWDNIEMLEKSNPCMPYMPTLRPFLEDSIKEAKRVGGHTEASIKIKNCGIWVDAAEVWIQSETIKKNNHGITEEDLNGAECYCGLDLAKGEDLNAFAMFFPNVKEGVHALKVMYWIPEDKVNDNRDHVDYLRWVQQGLMNQQPGNTANHMDITRDIIGELEKYSVKLVGYDSKYSISAFLPMMAEAGYEEVLRGVGQGFTLSPAVVQCAEWLKEEKLDLMNNFVLYWNLANVVMRVGDQGDHYPSKAKSENKIDGVSAMLTAMTVYLDDNSEIDFTPSVVVI